MVYLSLRLIWIWIGAWPLCYWCQWRRWGVTWRIISGSWSMLASIWGADRTRALHPEWTKTTIYLDMGSKIGTSTLHGAWCTGVLRCDLSKTGTKSSSRCHMGCQESETLTHIIMDCSHYKDCRLKLVRECDGLNLCLMWTMPFVTRICTF